MMVLSGGPLMIYTSPDLIHWTFNKLYNDIITDCPDLYPLTVEGTQDKKWIMKLGGQSYFVGDLTSQIDIYANDGHEWGSMLIFPAKKLQYVLGIDASFWINLQSNYDKELLESEEVNKVLKR